MGATILALAAAARNIRSVAVQIRRDLTAETPRSPRESLAGAHEIGSKSLLSVFSLRPWRLGGLALFDLLPSARNVI
ncbi:MAG: hypothetical protein ABR988_10705, partial [Terriglobales bacterium]